MREITIVLKGVPPSLNRTAGRKNVWEYRQTKQQWTNTVYYTCKACKDRPAAPFEKARVEITYYFPTRVRHDSDNYAGKFLLDGLTMAGVIADDDFKHISLTLAGAYDKENPRTEIKVTEIEKAACR